MMPTGLRLSTGARSVLEESLGQELYSVLERVGSMARQAGVDRSAARELRRLKHWLGPHHWRAMCLMLNDGRLTEARISPCHEAIKSFVCRDALILAMELESQKLRWGME